MSTIDPLLDRHIVDLAHPWFDGMPSSPTHPEFRFALRQRHGDQPRPDGLTGSHEMIALGGHVGTHMDALAHVAVGGHLHGETPVSDAVAGGRYVAHGIDTVVPLLRRGVLYDLPRLLGVPRLEAGRPVRREDLERGPRPDSGDVALVRTGWAQHWPTTAFLGDDEGVPGIDADAARWLAGHGVAVVGGDSIALEHIPPGGGLSALPVHRVLLFDHGINIIETMNLEPLAATGADEFVFVGAPLAVLGATGAPIRPLALVDPATPGPTTSSS